MSNAKQSTSLLRLLAFFFFIGACATAFGIASELNGNESEAVVIGHKTGRILTVRDSSGNEYEATVACPTRSCGYEIPDISHYSIGSSVKTVSTDSGKTYVGSKFNHVSSNVLLLTFFSVACFFLVKKLLKNQKK